MNKLTFAALLILAACQASAPTSETGTTFSGVKYTIFHTNPKGTFAPQISTVKARPILKVPDSIHNHLPLYKMVAPPAPYMTDVFAEILIKGVRDGDSIIINDKKEGDITYKIERVYIQNGKENVDSLIFVDKNKETGIMAQEQLKYGNNRLENYLKSKNIKAIKEKGVFVEILEKGVAPFADSGKLAGIKFESKSLYTGKIINSNADTSFHMPPVYEYKVATGAMFKPVDEIMPQLGKGGKARVYIPGIIALGTRATDPRADLTEDIVFSFEVMNVK
ncbi:MAG: hypothetical protein J7497_01075 [Chitinophagaceae bacterium]|nr:hypothetical protein [Chitinophagaceae bacterium]